MGTPTMTPCDTCTTQSFCRDVAARDLEPSCPKDTLGSPPEIVLRPGEPDFPECVGLRDLSRSCSNGCIRDGECDCYMEAPVEVGISPLTHPEAKSVNPKDIAATSKVATSLVPDVALIELAQAFRDGATKYGPYNWRDDPVKATVYTDAIARHFALYKAGQNFASDSKVRHLASIMSGCAILLDAELNGTLIDDRYKMANPDLLEVVLEQYKAANAN